MHVDDGGRKLRIKLRF